jgi:predicted kinase
MTGARLILICGLPGSGKTTLAKELEPGVPAIRLSPDEWKHDLGCLEAPVEELWRRLQLRNDEARPGAVPIKRGDLQKWALRFEAADAAELALFDHASP